MTKLPPVNSAQSGKNWLNLLGETDEQEFFSNWLKLLLSRYPEITEAVLVLGPANIGPFRPVALWPQGQTPSDSLVGSAEQVMQMRSPLTRNTPAGNIHAQPVLRQQDLYGVCAVVARDKLPDGFREWLNWGIGWLLLRVSARVDEADARLKERMMTALELMLSTMEERQWQAASQAAVTELAIRLGCDRVSVGFGDGQSVHFTSLSHSADFSKRIDLVRVIEAAMNEASDQGEAIWYSSGSGEPDGEPVHAIRITRAHQNLAHDYGNPLIYSVPFFVSEEAYGVFLFEWPDLDVDPVSRQLADSMPAILGRVLLEKREQQLPLHKRLERSFHHLQQRLFGPRHALFKLVTLTVLSLFAFFYIAKGDFNLPADARLEGATIRVIVSPYDAYVASSRIRAGHEVRTGDVLATLDDRDLRLEASRWTSQKLQFQKQLQDAEAQHDLAQVQIARAQVQQAAAQLNLVMQKLERASLRAPFDGVVVSGDLSQRLGAALRKGENLFEIAPLGDYRVALQVDEQDMAFIETGQQGRLMVAALPGREFPFTVKLITPVAQVSGGKNSFRVEASLDEGAEELRPGMEGIGKVSIGERRLIWIWSRRTLDWMRVMLWNWFGI